MRCLADFYLESDLCLPAGAPALQLDHPSGAYSLTLTNAEGDQLPAGAVLSARMVFDANEDLSEATEAAHQLMAGALNALVVSTNHKFKVALLWQLIDWTSGIVKRRAKVFHEVDERADATPELEQMYVNSAAIFAGAANHPVLKSAMRWYRRGVQATAPDEQFSYFWFALEIVSEAVKGSEKVASRCPVCRGSLFCPTCGKTPMHRRFAGEAIGQMIERMTGDPKIAEEIHGTLTTIRHTLLHGGSIDDVIDELPCDQAEAIDKLAQVTWHAMTSLYDPPPAGSGELNVGAPDSIVRRRMVASVDVITNLRPGGDPNAPRIEDFPRFSFTSKPLTAETFMGSSATLSPSSSSND